LPIGKFPPKVRWCFPLQKIEKSAALEKYIYLAKTDRNGQKLEATTERQLLELMFILDD
jgi:hypothetical protein